MHNLIEENYQKIIDGNRYGNRIWHQVSRNRNFHKSLVQLIFSRKGIQPEILNDDGKNVFFNSMRKKFQHKSDQKYSQTFPFFFSSFSCKQQKGEFQKCLFCIK